MRGLLCGRIFKPQELLCDNILARKKPYQDSTVLVTGSKKTQLTNMTKKKTELAPALTVRNIKVRHTESTGSDTAYIHICFSAAETAPTILSFAQGSA